MTTQCEEIYRAVIRTVFMEIESRHYMAKAKQIARFNSALAAWRRIGFSGLLHDLK
jgi:hypothetical protein